jgi:preprotein translocase subunit SecF
MFIVKYRKIFYALSLLLVIAGISALAVWGLKPGIDFKGGSLIEVAYVGARPDAETLRISIDALNIGASSIRPTGDTGYLVRTEELNPDTHQAVLAALSQKGAYKFEEKRFNSIGPVLGKEAIQKSYMSIAFVLLAIVLFITFVFRGVSRPVSSWKYGLIAIVALAHDVIIPAGAFAIMGHFGGIEVDTLFVTALLVILGFSIHDTIVVFDRIRENLHRNTELHEKKHFSTIVGESINQTFVRSINTSLTTLIAVVVLYVFGPEATRHFALALMIGITAGTYSSVFIGSPLLVTVEAFQARKK